MANDGQIVFEVTADGKHAIADIKDITRAIKQEAGKWDDAAKESAQNIDNSFSGVLKKLAAGFSAAKIGKALLDIGKEAVQAASDLQEVQNVVDVTFGAGAKQIESWAKTAGTQFGLTETQAKRFSSTMGAMLKSSGLAGEQIVGVSTDLAGLAADMASFYNLDFDTAFQKIRSGISGQTMPLKELGIDMSVATLNAFALKQGLTKTFDQMSQGEQVMLRYQYLMTATADAQGDFARTSDSYANSVRTLETNLTSLKTNLGTVLLDVINPLLNGINQLFPAEGGNRYSILDDLAEIKIKKDEKIAEITEIKSIADELVKTLESLGSDTNASTQLANLASSANTLDSSAKGNWQAVLQSLQGIDGLQNLFGDNSNAVGTVEDLAAALAGESVSTSKAQAWQIFLSALSNNADAVSKLTGSTVEETKAWLEGMAEAAGKLDPNDATSWNTLMTSLLSGVGMGETEEGKKFVELLAQNFLALGSDSAEAVNGLLALGYSTDEVADKQATWLKTCKELVKQIPGLSSIIDTNTGEIKGGIPAIKEYADEWERTAKYQAEVEAIRAARQLYEDNNNQSDLVAESVTKKAIASARMKNAGYDDVDEMLSKIPDIIQQYIDEGIDSWDTLKPLAFDLKTPLGANVDAVSSATMQNLAAQTAGVDTDDLSYFNRLTGESEKAMLDYAEAVFKELLLEKERPQVLESIEEEEKRVADEYGVTTEELEAQAKAAEEAAASMSTLEKAANGDADAMQEVKTATENAEKALREMADYAESVRTSVESSINNTVKGFGKIETPMMKAADKTTELTAKLNKLGSRTKKNAEEWDKLNDEINKYNGEKISSQGMAKNLEQQAEYMETYLVNLRKARELGISNEVLAQLSDGSEESYDYLAALAEASPDEVERINKAYQDVIDKKKELTGELTDQQLTADKVYESMANKAKEAVAALDLGEEAKTNSGKTIEEMAKGISDHVPDVQTAVDSIIEQLNRLDGWGINIDLGGFGNIQFTTNTGKTEGSARMGLDYVPHDDYIARLHEGEKVLSAQEASIYRGLANGSLNNVDLDSLGGVMRDNIRPGGNVYLDGKIVGTVVSDRQGRAYKQLQRSGWQA